MRNTFFSVEFTRNGKTPPLVRITLPKERQLTVNSVNLLHVVAITGGCGAADTVAECQAPQTRKAAKRDVRVLA